MEPFKKSVFGGYRKAEVDACMWNLEKRAEKAEADFAKAYADCEVLERAAGNLRAQLSEETRKNAELEARLGENKQTAPADSAVIGKVYLHAYETGADIAGTARDGAFDLMRELSTATDREKAEMAAVTQNLSEVGKEISELIDAILANAQKLQETLGQFDQKVQEISGVYDRLDHLRDQTGKRFDEAIAAYEQSAKTYLELLPAPMEKLSENPADDEDSDNDSTAKIIEFRT